MGSRQAGRYSSWDWTGRGRGGETGRWGVQTTVRLKGQDYKNLSPNRVRREDGLWESRKTFSETRSLYSSTMHRSQRPPTYCSPGCRPQGSPSDTGGVRVPLVPSGWGLASDRDRGWGLGSDRDRRAVTVPHSGRDGPRTTHCPDELSSKEKRKGESKEVFPPHTNPHES